MAKYRVLTPIKAADGKIYQPNTTIELTEEEAKNCLGFHAVELVLHTPQPVAQVQPESENSQKDTSVEDNIVPPESDVR
jgi:hypothetical protein